MKRFVFSVLIVICSVPLHAQKFLDSLRKTEPGQGNVTVVQSPEIDKLVNGTEKKQETTTATEHPAAANKPEKTAHEQEEKQKEEKQKETSHHEKPDSSSSNSTTEEPVIDTRKKMMRNSYKTKGYRIQVYTGGNSRADRQKAENAGTVMKSNFPNEPIYVHFYSPSWKCRMGNYKSIDEARKLLAKVKKLGYPQACIVKGTISVQY